jgi:hypothetical protein
MADAKFSGVGVVNLNGSIGNMTFARNFYGTYAKTRIGAPAGSTYLTTWNTEVGNLTAIWQNVLTESERAAWYTTYRVKSDSMADRIKITGFQNFMSVNLNLFLIGATGVTAPPADEPLTEIAPFSITSFAGGVLSVTGTNPVNTECAIYISWAMPVGRMSFNQIYAYIGHANINTAPSAIYSNTNPRVGVMTSGEKRFVKIVPINQNTGKKGTAYYDSIILP